MRATPCVQAELIRRSIMWHNFFESTAWMVVLCRQSAHVVFAAVELGAESGGADIKIADSAILPLSIWSQCKYNSPAQRDSILHSCILSDPVKAEAC